MNKFSPGPLICCCYFFILTSCASTRFDTKSVVVQGPDSTYISRHEVSVGDWLTYIVSTSFPEDHKTIKLGDHYNIIHSKLPALGPGRWDNYTINAFLRNSEEHVSVDFYNECKAHIIKIAVDRTAWDSIRKFQLMDLPITGITYEQALRYMEYKQAILNLCGFDAKDRYQYECFLPAPEQLDAVQTAMDSIIYQGCNLFNYKNALCVDCPRGMTWKNDPIYSRTGKEPTHVWAYFPDQFGLYNFKGNVAEMTSVKGIAEGGSCMHYATEAFNGRRQAYFGSAGWLGFRVWYRKRPAS